MEHYLFFQYKDKREDLINASKFKEQLIPLGEIELKRVSFSSSMRAVKGDLIRFRASSAASKDQDSYRCMKQLHQHYLET